MIKIYDIAIIGAGVAGAFAALRLAEKHKNTNAILIDLGKPPGKRRRQLEGWFGCFPTGDGKVYENDVNKVLQIADGRKVKAINKWFNDHLDSIYEADEIKSKSPKAAVLKKIKDSGFEIEISSYKQWYPKNIHQLSSSVSDQIDAVGNVTMNFDTEVFSIQKKNDCFSIETSDGDFKAKKVILCSGRSGWRWANHIYKKLNIIVEDEYAKYGIRAELPAQYLKDFNLSQCTLNRHDLTIGPFNWKGSVIQEDHADLTVAAFRSNEDRWSTEKVFFSIIANVSFGDDGCLQTDRLGKLAFLLSGDRVGRERIKDFIKKFGQVSDGNSVPPDGTLLDIVRAKEYSWIPKVLLEINEIIPNLISRGYFHCPDIITYPGRIHVSSNMETEVEGLFVAGENSGITGIAAAGITGALALEGALK